MNLAIDVGNTLIKWGVFSSGKLKLKKSSIKLDFDEVLLDIVKSFPQIENCIIALVGSLEEQQLENLEERFSVLYLNPQTKVPFINNYATPATLGVDRIAVISAAAQQFPNKNVLVIDAGTCITYDIINFKNEYLGGAISPGITLRYRALHTFTNKLPLLDPFTPLSITGNSTHTSMHSGVVHGVVFEVEGFIEKHKNNLGDLTVILTGGDAQFLRDSLKNDIFANSNFLLEGLNHILEYNIR